jgi:hypothetical protein
MDECDLCTGHRGAAPNARPHETLEFRGRHIMGAGGRPPTEIWTRYVCTTCRTRWRLEETPGVLQGRWNVDPD